MHMHVCVLDGQKDQEKTSFVPSETYRLWTLRSPPHVENTTAHLKGRPSTTAPLWFIMTAFLPAAKGEDQSDSERSRRRHGKEFKLISIHCVCDLICGVFDLVFIK